MGTQTERVRMTLKDEVSKVANKIERNLNMTGVLRGNIVSFNAAAEVAQKFFRVLKSGVRVIGSFIEASNEQARVNVQLEAVLRSTGNAAGFVATEVQKQAAAMQELSLFQDDVIQGAQNILLTFTNIKDDIFPQTTQIVLDMAQSLGQDLKSASIQVGKALNNPIIGVSALAEVGVAFTEQQKEQIKTLVESGRVMDAQRIILKELAVEFGGSALAATKTFGGEIKQIANQFNDFKESVGDVITESADLRATIRVLAQMFEKLGSNILDAAGSLDNLEKEGKNTFQVIFDGIRFVRIGFVGLKAVVRGVANTFLLMKQGVVVSLQAINLAVKTVAINFQNITRQGIQMAADAAFAAGLTGKALELQSQADLLGSKIELAELRRNKLRGDIAASQKEVNKTVTEFARITADARLELDGINDDSLVWNETLANTTRELRAAKVETIALAAAEKAMADQRELQRQLPFLARPDEGQTGPTPFFQLQENAESPEEKELQKRRDFTSKILQLDISAEQKAKNFRDRMNADRLKGAVGVGNALLGLGQELGKKNVKAQKAINIAQAIMSTHTAAAKALELGPIAGPIAAAAILATGFLRVKAIASTKIGGGSSGGSVGGGFTPSRPSNDIFQRGAGFQSGALQGRNEGIVVNINTGGAPILREAQLGDLLVDILKNRLGRDGSSLNVSIGAGAA